MKTFLPIFPLELVVYPGESLHLHIFEPRYRQLINECADTKMVFGIPTVIDQKIGDLGTTVELVEITETHPNGEMDIKTRGVEIFRIQEVVKSVPGKLYSGARVEKVKNNPQGDEELMRQILSSIRLMLKMLKLEKSFGKPGVPLTSYDVAHHAGLSLEQEYEFLGIFSEQKRQEYLNHHLSKILPVVMEMESLKQKIQLNGHFKALPGFDA